MAAGNPTGVFTLANGLLNQSFYSNHDLSGSFRTLIAAKQTPYRQPYTATAGVALALAVFQLHLVPQLYLFCAFELNFVMWCRMTYYIVATRRDVRLLDY